MRKLTPPKALIILICALFLTICCAAEGVLHPEDPISLGEVLAVATRLHAEQAGTAAPSFTSEDYSEVKNYAQTNGIATADEMQDLSRSALQIELAEYLFRAYPEADYTVINSHISALPYIGSTDFGYKAALFFFRSGIFSDATLTPGKTVTYADVHEVVSRLMCPEFREKADEFTYTEPKPSYLLAIAPEMDIVREGIQSGWQYDNVGGPLRTTIKGNKRLLDVRTDARSRVVRHFNHITEGKIEIQAQVLYQYNFNGNAIEICDDDGSLVYRLFTEENTFKLLKPDETVKSIYTPTAFERNTTITFRIIINLDTGNSITYINNTLCGGINNALLGNGIKTFAFCTSDNTMNRTVIGKSLMYANYLVYENLDYADEKPPMFTKSGTGTVTYTNNEFGMAADTVLSTIFDKNLTKTSFAWNAYLPADTSASFVLCSEGVDIVQVTAQNGKLYANGVDLNKTFSDKLWYKFRIEADPWQNKAAIKVNGKVVGTVEFLAPCGGFDEIQFKNNATAAGDTTTMKVDDILVYTLIDYDVPEPVIPAGADNYTIGINVCSLWRNGDHWGWAPITPHNDIRPVLGYYDEGSPEVADWEIKFMAEHGIDFQAFCWYASEVNAPMKTTGLSAQLEDAYMHAKYSDCVKFSLIWETSSGAIPESEQAFYDYYVPYWIENYFSDPRYMTMDNQLVFSIFGQGSLITRYGTELKTMFTEMERMVKEATGKEMIFLVSGVNLSEQNLSAYGFDGWHAYNYSSNGYSYDHNVNCITEVTDNNPDISVVPTVSVGFNEVSWYTYKWESDGIPTRRFPMMSIADYEKIHKWVRDTYLPTYSNASAKNWTKNFLWLSTWNEYGEGTYIMPADGLHGFGYLDVLRKVYTNGGTHTDVVPTEEEKKDFTHLYPQDRRLLRAHANYIPLRAYDPGTTKTVYLTNSSYSNYLTCSSSKATYLGTTSAGSKYCAVDNDVNMYIQSAAYTGLAASDISTIRVTASGIPSGQRMVMYFQTSSTSGYPYAVSPPSPGLDEYVFEIAMDDNPDWAGTIKTLRLDPFNNNIGAEFTIKSIAFVKSTSLPVVYINSYKLNSYINPQYNSNSVLYVPFDPSRNFIDYWLYITYDWDYDAGKLTWYKDGKTIVLTVGSNIAYVDGEAQTLKGAVYLEDNIPMIPIYNVCSLLGCGLRQDGSNYYINTTEKYLFEKATVITNENKNGHWQFNLAGYNSDWTSVNMTEADGENGETLIYTSYDYTDSYIQSANKLGLNCADYSKLRIICRMEYVRGTSNKLCVFFTTEDSTAWDTDKYVEASIPVVDGGAYGVQTDGFVTIDVDLSSNANWSGTLRQLRIDPFSTIGVCEIDSIQLVE